MLSSVGWDRRVICVVAFKVIKGIGDVLALEGGIP
jgi:hypothetical protein